LKRDVPNRKKTFRGSRHEKIWVKGRVSLSEGEPSMDMRGIVIVF